MTDKYETEILRRVFDNDSGSYMHIGPSPDFPSNVILRTGDGYDNEGYFGKISLDMPAEFMRLLAHAILSAADESEAQRG